MPLKYITIGQLGLSCIKLINANAEDTGEVIAELAACIIGILYGLALKRYHRQPKQHTLSNKKNKHNAPRNAQEQEETFTKVDDILDKVSRTGYKSLTEEEKLLLFEEESFS